MNVKFNHCACVYTERSARRSAVLTMGERTGGLSFWPRTDWSWAAVTLDSNEARVSLIAWDMSAGSLTIPSSCDLKNWSRWTVQGCRGLSTALSGSPVYVCQTWRRKLVEPASSVLRPSEIRGMNKAAWTAPLWHRKFHLQIGTLYWQGSPIARGLKR